MKHDLSNARKTRTEQARKVLADTHIARPILSGVRKALATKRGNLVKNGSLYGKEDLSRFTEEDHALLAQYDADLEALQRVEDLLDRMNAKAFEALQADLRRDIAAEIASSYAQPAEVSS